MRKRMGRVLLVVSILIVAAAVFVFYAFRTTQTGPDFYQKALAVDSVAAEIAGDQLETRVLDLHNDVLQPGRWEASFTEEQINGWLATVLVEKFPKALPASINNPRISLQDDRIELAFSYHDEKISGVVSAAVTVFLTDNENELAVQVLSLRAGIVPLPLSRITDKISQSGIRVGMPVRWSTRDGEPVALITLPQSLKKGDDQVWRLIAIKILEDSLRLNGETQESL